MPSSTERCSRYPHRAPLRRSRLCAAPEILAMRRPRDPIRDALQSPFTPLNLLADAACTHPLQRAGPLAVPPSPATLTAADAATIPCKSVGRQQRPQPRHPLRPRLRTSHAMAPNLWTTGSAPVLRVHCRLEFHLYCCGIFREPAMLPPPSKQVMATISGSPVPLLLCHMKPSLLLY
jgi:hypothetical protein